MGINGLVGYITHNNLFSECYLSKETVIVDGYNFLYSLYFTEKLDVKHGGEYADFYKIFNKFITALEECNVKPIFVFDGGQIDDRKFPTIRKRFEVNLNKSLRIGKAGDDEYIPILPLFCSHTMIKLFRDRSVCAVWCDFEADQEIAKIANTNMCPVLSADSDFYIMDLPNGIISTENFAWKAVTTSRSIKCNIYKRDVFCRETKISRECISLVAVFAGNDFNKRRMKIEEAICLLGKHTSVDSAVNEALESVKNLEKKKRQKKEIMSSLSAFEIPEYSSTLDYLENNNAEMPASELNSYFPPWFIARYRKGGVNKDFVDVVRHNQRFLNHYVEDKQDPCADNASLSLRKWQYAILQIESNIKEYFREADKLTCKAVTPKNTIEPDRCVSNLVDIEKLSPEQRKDWFFSFLETNKDEYENIPTEFHLPIASFKFWLKHCKPETKYVYALLSSWIVAVDSRNDQGVTSLPTYEKIEFNPSASHAFSEWQSIMEHTISLNQLLMSPISECDVTVIYNGRLVFFLLEKKEENIKAYLRERVPQFSESAKDLYDALKIFIE